MIEKLRNLKATYIFNIIAILLLLGTFSIYTIFEQTRKNIVEINLKAHIDYIDTVTTNIARFIKKSIPNNIHQTLKNDEKLRYSIEQNLQFFITNRYRYIYVVDKENIKSKEFRFLLDGAIDHDDKSEFDESYIPLNLQFWNKVYEKKEALYFKHSDTYAVWMTYLKPIVINNKVEAIIVIDFSLQEHDLIVSSLDKLDNSFEKALIFAIFIFLVIIIFSYSDMKRENAKKTLYTKLKKTNQVLKQRTRELKLKTKNILEFNKTLEQKVKDEIDKNKLQDQQMLQQSRLAQMGEMISMIAHQWRQPLTAISSRTNNLIFKIMMGEEMKRDVFQQELSYIDEYSQHLSKTIDDFRGFFKDDKIKQKATLEEIVKSTLDIVQISLENKNITMKTNFQCNLELETYPNEVKQVVLNLIKNAEDILIENKIENPIIIIETSCDDIYKQLTIKDNAGGIPNEIMSKIFDPYFSTKKSKNGTGLGLYMSKTIIEEHCAGKLTVSNDNDGAVFKLVLGEIDV